MIVFILCMNKHIQSRDIYVQCLVVGPRANVVPKTGATRLALPCPIKGHCTAPIKLPTGFKVGLVCLRITLARVTLRIYEA